MPPQQPFAEPAPDHPEKETWIFDDYEYCSPGAENVGYAAHGTGSSDYGDIQHLVPGIHPYVGGAIGTEHGSDYAIQDREMLYLVAAKAMAMTAIDLLANGAEKALEIKQNFTPVYANKEEYLAAWEELMK